MTTGRAGMRPSSTIGVGNTRIPLGWIYAALLAFLYLPIILLFVFSFSTSRGLVFPIEGLTLDRYLAVFDNAQMLNAARNSLIVGTMAATAATVLGLAVGLSVTRFQFRGRGSLLGLAIAPLLIPSGALSLLVVDVLACWMRRVPLAGLPLLAVYCVPISVIGANDFSGS